MDGPIFRVENGHTGKYLGGQKRAKICQVVIKWPLTFINFDVILAETWKVENVSKVLELISMAGS